MGTDDNGYELSICHQLGKGQNPVPAPVFQPIHPQFLGYLYLDFEDTYADTYRSAVSLTVLTALY